MDAHHSHHAGHAQHTGPSLNRTAWSATLHCLTGCAIGEVLGMVIGTALGWGNAPTIALAVVLAFFFGYALTLRPLLSAMLGCRCAAPCAGRGHGVDHDHGDRRQRDHAGDSRRDGRRPRSVLFWASLAFSLAVAAVAAFPANRWLIARGKGHAVVHAHHHH